MLNSPWFTLMLQLHGSPNSEFFASFLLLYLDCSSITASISSFRP